MDSGELFSAQSRDDIHNPSRSSLLLSLSILEERHLPKIPVECKQLRANAVRSD